MAKIDLREYALRGARTRLAELNDEIKAIRAAFPALRTETGGKREKNEEQDRGETTRRSRRKRSRMSAEQRKAVGERMKKYWAERKASAKK